MSPVIQNHSRRTRLFLCVAAAAALTSLTACGADKSNAVVPAAAGGDTTTRAVVRTHARADGPALVVDRSGRTLYAADQEGAGKDIQCTGSCLRIWVPLTAATGPVKGAGVAADRLGSVMRPDNGQTQVVLDGKPLYTFTLDTAAGMTKGDGVTDDFNGTTFHWHALTTDGSSTASPSTQRSGGGVHYGY